MRHGMDIALGVRRKKMAKGGKVKMEEVFPRKEAEKAAAAQAAREKDMGEQSRSRDSYLEMASSPRAVYPEIGPHADVYAGAHESRLRQMLGKGTSVRNRIQPEERYSAIEDEKGREVLPEQKLAEGGMISGSEDMAERIRKRMRERQAAQGHASAQKRDEDTQAARQQFVNEHATGGSSGDAELDKRRAERQQEDEAMHSHLAYGGQVEMEGDDDFLALEGHEGQGQLPAQEDPQMRRRKRLESIMADLHKEHYGR